MIGEYPLIPEEAFLYFPESNRIVEQRKGERQRILFEGGLEYTKQQKERIEQLRNYIKKQQNRSILSKYPDNFLFRFLQAASFNYKQCIKNLEIYQRQTQKQMLSSQNPEQFIRFLRQGTIYFCGRDYHFRPIIIVDIKKLLDIQIKTQQLLGTLSFFFQFLIDNCLIEGQVQTWNTIVDIGECGLLSLGGTLVGIIKHLSSIFKARSNHTYLIGCPSSMNFLWRMVKNVLNEDQLRKITMTDKKILRQQDFVKINKNQVQSKYGGNRPNINSYWPIQIDPYAYKVENLIVNLISQQQYQHLFNEGKLKDRKVKFSLVGEGKKKEIIRKMTSFHQNEAEVLTSSTKFNNFQEDQQFLYPQQKRPQIPVQVQGSFSFQDLFN